MEANLEHIVVIAILTIALFTYVLSNLGKKRKTIFLKAPFKNEGLNSSKKRATKPILMSLFKSNDLPIPAKANPIDSSKKELMFNLFNDLSIQQIEDGIKGIKTYFEKNFSINLAAYEEGCELIGNLIECPEKREKMYNILDNVITETQKMHFLTGTGWLECAQIFKMKKKSVELNFPHIKGLTFKEYYVN